MEGLRFLFFSILILALICLSVISEISSKFFENPSHNSAKNNKNQPKTTPRPPQNHPGSKNGSQAGPRRYFSPFWLHLGSLGAPVGEPFRCFGSPGGPRTEKNDALESVCSQARFFSRFSLLLGALDP